MLISILKVIKYKQNVKDFKMRVNDALERVVNMVFHKLTYINAPKDDIDIRNLLKRS